MNTRLAGDRRSPGAARAFIAGQLTSSTVPDGVPVDDVILVVSELTTNAVQAGARWIDLTLRVSPRRLDLLVADDAPGWPTMAHARAPDEAANGRGLVIVDQLTDDWTVTARAEGKLVTATWLDRAPAISR